MDFLGAKLESEMLPVLTFHETTKVATNTQVLQCLKCDKLSTFPAEKDDYLAHLFLEHRLIIADEEEIALLPEYLQYWLKEFKEHEFEEYCTTMLLDQLPDGTPAKNEKYYLLSDVLPKDYELRKMLQQQRLEQALAQHQYERTDREFNKECLYCREVIKGLRADFLAHLFNKHFLQLGKPENLVYVDELIEKVQHNLEHLICLYCEKVFKDRITLKEHMRKKLHKRINPNNRAYDRFFLINYRYEKPKQTHNKQLQATRQQTIKKSQQAAANKTKTAAAAVDTSTASCSAAAAAACHSTSPATDGSVDFERRFANNSDDSDSDWSDWNGEQTAPLNCLYCTHEELAFAPLKAHMLAAHQVDFDAGVKDLNFYQKIKIVNYVRRQICLLRCVSCNLRCETRELLEAHMREEVHYSLGSAKDWEKPEYFFPTYEDDGLLCILDDNPNDDVDDTVVRIISEDSMAQINKDAERLSLENFNYLY